MSDPPGTAAQFDGLLEASLYHDAGERETVERFYTEALGLAAVADWPDGLAFRVGASILLLFDREGVGGRDGPIAEHGSSGPGHACFLTDRDGYARWGDRLRELAIEITHEHEWSGGRRSLYFKDPAGNLLEIADGDLWPGAD